MTFDNGPSADVSTVPDGAEPGDRPPGDELVARAADLGHADGGSAGGLARKLTGPIAAIIAVIRSHLASMAEPMRANPDHPQLHRSGWVDLAIMLPLALILVVLELLIFVP